MKKLSTVAVFLPILLLACPPAPVVPVPDASDATPPAPSSMLAVDAGSFETTVCAALADAGCALGTLPTCPAAILSNKLPQGGYVTTWAACLYSGAAVSSCQVPCSH